VIFVSMNILYRERWLRHIVADAESRAIVVPLAIETTGQALPE
jgi:hypothetical protein